MSKISGKETKPEILVRKYLFAQGFRFRKNVKGMAGTPDILLPKYRTVIFVHGCFWHGHNCKASKLPETRKEFWQQKIQSNIDRDRKNIRELIDRGWNIITIWQCEINTVKKRLFRLNALAKELREININR
jgi:DNA mismatch endonuclease (patch repair protein)